MIKNIRRIVKKMLGLADQNFLLSGDVAPPHRAHAIVSIAKKRLPSPLFSALKSTYVSIILAKRILFRHHKLKDSAPDTSWRMIYGMVPGKSDQLRSPESLGIQAILKHGIESGA